MAGTVDAVAGAVADARDRACTYWYQDGLVELVLGAVYLVVAGVTWLSAHLSGPLAGIVPPVVSIGVVWAGQRVIPAAKSAITYPRTGYVRTRHPVRSPGLRGAIVACLLLGVLLSGLAAGSGSGALAVLCESGLLAAAVLLLGVRLPRHYLLAASILIGGIALSGQNLAPDTSSALLFGVSGAVMLVCGGAVLAWYVVQHRAPGADGGSEPGVDR